MVKKSEKWAVKVLSARIYLQLLTYNYWHKDKKKTEKGFCINKKRYDFIEKKKDIGIWLVILRWMNWVFVFESYIRTEKYCER